MSLVWIRVALVLGLVASLLGTGFYLGSTHVHRQWAEETQAQQAAVARDFARRVELSSRIDTTNHQAQERIRVVTKEILRDVPRYVYVTGPSDDNATDGVGGGCRAAGPGFRVLHDAAAKGVPPGPASLTDAAPVDLADVAGTVIENYGTCLATAEQLRSLQQWIKQQTQDTTQ